MHEKGPVLSVVVPVYNGSIYIDELFSQLEGQKLDGVEMVFVDDGSDDDSWEKLLKYTADPQVDVKVYHQENRGASAARNHGVQMSRGAYITFMDVDDAIACNYFETLLRYAAENVDVLTFASKRVTVSFGELKREFAPDLPVRLLTKDQMLRQFWEDPTKLCVTTIMAKRSHLLAHKIVSPVGYKYYEDYDLLLQLFAQTEQIHVLNQELYYYLLRDGSAMGKFNADRINCLKLMKEREKWLQEVAPGFAPTFAQWGVARLYWSVLWQSALALDSYREFTTFADLTEADRYLKKLKGFPDKLLQISTLVYFACRPAYYLAVRLVGRRRSKVYPVKLEDITSQLLDDIKFYE